MQAERRFRHLRTGMLRDDTPAIVISLDDQEQRRTDLIARGIPGEWAERYFPAIDLRGTASGALLSYADVARLEAQIGRAVRPAEIGCALSHRAVAGWLTDSPFPMALVLEDDVIPQTEEWLAQVGATSSALLPYAQSGAAFVCPLVGGHPAR